MVWYVSGSTVHGEFQGLVCCQADDECGQNGVTASGYAGEYTWQIGAVSYGPVGDEIIPSNAKDSSLACHVDCGMPAACVSLPLTVSRFQHHEGLLPGHM